MRMVVLAMIMLSTYSTCAQTRYGTVVVLNRMKDKLIVSADSRSVFAEQTVDSYCKIAIFGHRTVFTRLGASAYIPKPHDQVPAWDALDAAREVVRIDSLSGEDAQSRMRNIIEEWARRAASHFLSMYRWHPDELKQTAQSLKGYLLSGIFAQAINQKIYVLAAVLTFDEQASPPVVMTGGEPGPCWPCGQTDGSMICAGGEIEIPQQLCSEVSKPGGSSNKTILDFHLSDVSKPELLPIRIADLTVASDHTGNVGGKIDALELDKDGTIRWLARKENCPDNND